MSLFRQNVGQELLEDSAGVLIISDSDDDINVEDSILLENQIIAVKICLIMAER